MSYQFDETGRRGITRRQWLTGVSAASACATFPGAIACSSDDGNAPDTLPSYEYDGPKGPSTMFELGVASGDPTSSAVILWTHVSSGSTKPIDVWLDVAEDEAFENRVMARSFTVDDSTDFTLKVDAQDLGAGRTYYYRFFALGVASPVGRTRTLPEGDVASLRLGMVCCSNYGFGYFHAYGRLAERDDLDAILALGDYIYEYPNNIYPFDSQRVRDTAPLEETISLEQYRERYRHYRKDGDLQAAHRQHPWFLVWDDHEVADNGYDGGAVNHMPDMEGDWATRLAAGERAFYEYVPVRGTAETGVRRSVSVGKLVDLILLDTRYSGRSQQIGDPADDTDDRTMLGMAQEAWFEGTFAASKAKWRLIGQQIVLAQYTNDPVTQKPIYMDQWDGYPKARARLFETLTSRPDGNVVVVTGDLHGSCVFELTEDPWSTDYDPSTGAGAFAVEFVVPAVTSPYNTFDPVTTEEDDLKKGCPHLAWTNLKQNGFAVIDVTAEQVQCDFYVFGSIKEGSDGVADWAKGFVVKSGSAHAIAADTAAG
jgi:alkaline phosphatase D